MLIKLIFLIMLCIPVGCLQYYLLTETLKDLKKGKKVAARKQQPTYYEDPYFQREYLKVVR
ncbi:hypothetical protein [Geosporobacter ferrireducens]|uniref:Uncharacterized protein n=1 Tax=Geosporobacter ferrireducens TaxID=1424294 RepID=A0A1D8GHA2_9FIRM|nr:hypothetical protein [Geosporobacter ferrireducens]AOT70294.1 hypothetical protein Gferi_12225 [Geosporobacter ferrireducens]MTI55742.1 hypothetical protein [Geosporobacter ferrireducens]